MWSCDSPLDGRFGGRAGGPGAARTYREHDRAAVAHQVCDLLWLDRPVEDNLDRLPLGVDQQLETSHQRQELGIAERRSDEIGRAHVCTPINNEQIVCRRLLEKKT